MSRDPDVKIGIRIEDHTRAGLAQAEKSIRESLQRTSRDQWRVMSDQARDRVGGAMSPHGDSFARQVRDTIAGRIRAQRMEHHRELVREAANARLAEMGFTDLIDGQSRSTGFRSRMKEINRTLAIVRGGGALGGLVMTARWLGRSADEATRLRNELAQGAITLDQWREGMIGAIPVLGDFWRAGRAIREAITGEQLALEQARARDEKLKAIGQQRATIAAAGQGAVQTAWRTQAEQARAWAMERARGSPFQSTIGAWNAIARAREGRGDEARAREAAILKAAGFESLDDFNDATKRHNREREQLEARARAHGLSVDNLINFQRPTGGRVDPRFIEQSRAWDEIERIRDEVKQQRDRLNDEQARIGETRTQLARVRAENEKIARADVGLQQRDLIRSMMTDFPGFAGTIREKVRGLMGNVPGARMLRSFFEEKAERARREAVDREIRERAGESARTWMSFAAERAERFRQSMQLDTGTGGNVGLLTGSAGAGAQLKAVQLSQQQLDQIKAAIPILSRMAETLTRIQAAGPGLAVRVAEF